MIEPEEAHSAFAPRGFLTHEDVRRLEASDRAIPVELPAEGSPPLIVISRVRLPQHQIAYLRALMERARRGRCVVFDGDLDVFQLIDGRWQPLGPRS
jgi:hypothetical protein